MNNAIKSLANRILPNKFWLILWVGFFVFFYLTPMTGDDLTFFALRSSVTNASDLFEVMVNFYNYTNGRILANFFPTLFAHGTVVSSLVRATMLASSVWLIVQIFEANLRWQRNLFVLAFLLIPMPILAQAIVWRSGFYVYVFPITLFLLGVWMLKKSLAEEVKLGTKIKLFIISLLVCLFVETITLAVVATLSFGIVWTIVSRTDISIKLLTAGLAGALIGSVLMFGSPVYSSVIEGKDSYRGVGVVDIHKNKGNPFLFNAYQISRLTISHHPVLFVPMGLVILGFVIRERKNIERRKMSKVIAYLAPAAFMYMFFANNLLYRSYISEPPQRLSQIIDGAHILIIVFFLWAFIYSSVNLVSKKFRKPVIVLHGFYLLTLSPLVLINPYGHRNIYLPALSILVVSIVVIYSNYINTDQGEGQLLNKLTLYPIFAVGTVYILMMTAVYRVDSYNMSIIKSYDEGYKGVIHLRRLPFESFLHDEYNVIKTNRAVAGFCDNQKKFHEPVTCYDLNIVYDL